jgi:hypothetical protein
LAPPARQGRYGTRAIGAGLAGGVWCGEAPVRPPMWGPIARGSLLQLKRRRQERQAVAQRAKGAGTEGKGSEPEALELDVLGDVSPDGGSHFVGMLMGEVVRATASSNSRSSGAPAKLVADPSACSTPCAGRASGLMRSRDRRADRPRTPAGSAPPNCAAVPVGRATALRVRRQPPRHLSTTAHRPVGESPANQANPEGQDGAGCGRVRSEDVGNPRWPSRSRSGDSVERAALAPRVRTEARVRVVRRRRANSGASRHRTAILSASTGGHPNSVHGSVPTQVEAQRP